jgi:hypothetical protein
MLASLIIYIVLPCEAATSLYIEFIRSNFIDMLIFNANAPSSQYGKALNAPCGMSKKKISAVSYACLICLV